MRNALIAAAMFGVIVLIAVALYAQRPRQELRTPTDRESFDYLIAMTFEYPQLCDTIDPRAFGDGGGWPGGAWFGAPWNRTPERSLQSMCRENLAHVLQRPAGPLRRLDRDQHEGRRALRPAAERGIVSASGQFHYR